MPAKSICLKLSFTTGLESQWNRLTVSGVSLTPSNSRPGLSHLQKRLH